ncbi:MAG: glycosyltransferase family 2 protein [Paracoccaceae bacterium]
MNRSNTKSSTEIERPIGGDVLDVAFVLPCLNEAKTIEWCVRRAIKALETLRGLGLDGEVIVADNGSTDGSQDLAEKAGARVVHVSERGYGAALTGGFEATDARYLVMGDSDCSYDFLEATKMVEELMNGADLCMGSRFKGEIKPGAMPWKNRYIGNPALSGILRFLFRTSISDAHCGLRAFTRDAYTQLNPSSTGMEFASEMVLKAVLQGLVIREVPITLHPDQRDRPPHLNPWRDGLRHLIYMLLLSPKHLFLWPASILFAISVCLFTVLLSAGEEPLAYLGPLRFGDHFAVVASAMMIVAVQTAIVGVFALIYGVQQGFRSASPYMRSALRYSRLERWVFGGLFLASVGFVWASTITAGWIESDYGQLNRFRDLLAAATLIVIGFQAIFSGFLLSILSGNRASHTDLL